MSKSYREWLSERVIDREALDRFFDVSQNNWAKFDPELGYVLRDSRIPDGIEGTHTIYRYEPYGARRLVNYRQLPCRINTYGDSMTQCHQVSDGETWQEILAAHLGEPIRNFGVGGYGVYQAYRRLRRHEETEQGVPNIVFYIYHDDHRRSLFPCRWLFTHGWNRRGHPGMIHSLPWVHLAPDLEAGGIKEMPNPFDTSESVYTLSDPTALHEAFHASPIVKIEALCDGVTDLGALDLAPLADWAGIAATAWKKRFDTDPASSASDLLWFTAYRASYYLLDKLCEYLSKSGKRMLLLLGYSKSEVARYLGRGFRPDSDVLEYLDLQGIRYVDILSKHRTDYADFEITADAYMDRLSIGHYNPAGNFFFAFAIKNDLVDWLEPKPRTYRQLGASISFEGYLDQ